MTEFDPDAILVPEPYTPEEWAETEGGAVEDPNADLIGYEIHTEDGVFKVTRTDPYCGKQYVELAHVTTGAITVRPAGIVRRSRHST